MLSVQVAPCLRSTRAIRPIASARAVIEMRLHREIRIAAGFLDHFVDQLVLIVAARDRAFRAFLDVEHQRYGDAGAVGPLGMGRVFAIAKQIPMIHHSAAPPFLCVTSIIRPCDTDCQTAARILLFPPSPGTKGGDRSITPMNLPRARPQRR